jgi:hypothetical protein
LRNAAKLAPVGGWRLLVADAGEHAVDLRHWCSGVLQRSPCLRLLCVALLTPPCFDVPL